MSEPRAASKRSGDLTVTALYTAQTWHWGGFAAAELLAHRDSRRVFAVTNFVMHLFRLFRRGAPSLPHSLVQRHAIIDALVQRSGCNQVLELAAGLSRRGAAMSANPDLLYIEVDLPPVVARKRELLGRTQEGRSVLNRANLDLVAADVESAKLSDLVGDGPVCVVAEGLLMYLDAAAQQALWRRLAVLVSGRAGSVVIFDLIPAVEEPPPGLLGRMLAFLFARFTKGRGFTRDQRTRHDIVAEIQECGLHHVDLIEPREAPEIEIPFLDVKTQVLVFLCRTRDSIPSGKAG
ncbi:MAG: hypothetical protein A2289_11755 [Deltaproteobacteria bacterium RIFOXYA12_FULL_58_15]|nr:MAG: hypothetical protein A2289_11755 [Deltaproteobacteria bacterium RIFOXYA12_FULL_58_15]OGR11143.1 MAG: hypothetical protein A2341_12180 [Deltaproteobacteria bacterium RIFOXYB12_FULL_58_9]